MGEGSDDGAIGQEVTIEIAGFDVEDVDEDTNVGEDMLTLLGEVVFHESILTAKYELLS